MSKRVVSAYEWNKSNPITIKEHVESEIEKEMHEGNHYAFRMMASLIGHLYRVLEENGVITLDDLNNSGISHVKEFEEQK